jgi:hypothetical protein
MERRTAVAAAAAISISLLSAFVGVGAHLGSLGFAKSTPAPAIAAATTATNPATSSATSPATAPVARSDDGSRGVGVHGTDDGSEAETVVATADRATRTTGAHDD